MNAQLWPHIKALFEAAMAQPSTQREAWLRSQQAEPEVLAEVLSLLAHSTAMTPDTGFLATPVQPPAPSLAAAAQPGLRLGAWALCEQLGSGGMGEVWRASRADGAYQGEAAVKLLKRGMDSAAVLRRFAQEQQALARLDHPHIARLLDAGLSPEGLPYFVMELVHGQPIDRACAGLALEAQLALFLQLADAVAYAHRHLLVHRDLKPGNVLVNAEGQVKLLDFGIAKALDPLEGDGDGAGQTLAGEQRPYTPHYASPEQVRGEPVSTATDLYSLGVLLYVMLTGVRPYGREASTPREAAHSVLAEAPTRPSALSPALVPDPDWLARRRRLRGDLDNILLKTLQKEPAQRYSSVEALADDVRGFLAGRPVSAHPPSPAYLALKFVQRHRIGSALGGAALAAVLGFAGLAWQQARAAQERFTQVRQLANQLVFKYHDQIETLPGATKVREALLTDAATFLDQLSRSAQDDLALTRELADTYYRISRLQGVDQSINTGQHALAEANLDKAIALARRYAQRPDTSLVDLGSVISMHASKGEVWQRRGQMARADQALRESLPLLATAMQRDPKDTSTLTSAVNVHGIHARILGNQLGHASLGRWQEACTSADQARAAAEATLQADPLNVYLPDTIAFTIGEQAQCKLMLADWAGAESLFKRQIELRDQMAAKMPEDMDFRYQRAVARGHLARALSLQGKHAEAQALLGAAQRLMREAVAMDKGNEGGQRRLDALDASALAMRVMADDLAAARKGAAALLPRLAAPAPEADFAQRRPRAEALLWAARAWQPSDAARAGAMAQEAAALMQAPAGGDDNASRRWLQAMALTEQAQALNALGQVDQALAAAQAALRNWGEDGDAKALPVPPLLQSWRAYSLALARQLRAAATGH
ncbi:serine/threonine-protein kinase [Paucibacter soli]|uniref:serine/threonine-protein kinase n=1 Tax=Paucibacter soli TaxID=3133433 RepID=UPI0030A4AE64